MISLMLSEDYSGFFTDDGRLPIMDNGKRHQLGIQVSDDSGLGYSFSHGDG